MQAVTYHDLITHADNLGVQFIPWGHCKRGHKLGHGASMNVFAGTYEVNGVTQEVAFKSIIARLTGTTREKKRSFILRDIRQEIRIMGRLKGHSRIVQLLGVSFDEYTPILILELARSNLEDYLQDGERVEWKIKLGFMYDIALGLEAIHRVQVVHGDLKAANILIYDSDNDQKIAKISDFGFSSTDVSVREGHIPGFSNNFRSRESFDPELKDWNGKHTTDVYSYGLLVYQIAHDGTTPFEDYDIEEIDDMKKEGTELSVLMNLLPDDTPAEIRKIITVTVRSVPSERSGLDEVKKLLKESAEWSQVYSYEDAKVAFESLVQAGPNESIWISKMDELSIPAPLKESIFHEYQQFADAGDIAYQYRLGLCWDFGFGTEQDHSKAFEYYAMAAERGDMDAYNSLGSCYYSGNGVTKDYAKAVEIYTKATKVGNAYAQYNLGVCYFNGEGTAKDDIKAFELFKKAAEANNINAQYNLGYCYEHGHGVTKNHIKAIEWYTKAAEASNSDAQYNLGLYYYNNKDYVKAVELYIKAAEAGDIDAQINLGICYENGYGITKDYVKAVELYAKAAEAGDSDAQNYLGRCYENGYGVTKDRIKALELYKRAAEGGHPSDESRNSKST